MGLLDKIKPLNFALGANDGEHVVFELSSSNFGDHRVRKTDAPGFQGEAGRSTITVRSESLDAVAKDIDPNELSSGSIRKVSRATFSAAPGVRCVHARRSASSSGPDGLDRSDCYRLLRDALTQNGYTQFYDLGAD